MKRRQQFRVLQPKRPIGQLSLRFSFSSLLFLVASVKFESKTALKLLQVERDKKKCFRHLQEVEGGLFHGRLREELSHLARHPARCAELIKRLRVKEWRIPDEVMRLEVPIVEWQPSNRSAGNTDRRALLELA